MAAGSQEGASRGGRDAGSEAVPPPGAPQGGGAAAGHPAAGAHDEGGAAPSGIDPGERGSAAERGPPADGTVADGTVAGGGSQAAADAADARGGARPAPSWFGGKLLFWLPWPLLVALDLWSKAAVFDWLVARHGDLRGEHVVFAGELLTFKLVTWENTGTIWGLFQDGTVALMVLRCAAVLGLLWFVRVTSSRARLQLLILSLIFAGAIGNLYDNFTRTDAESPRSVRDFLRFEGDWPVAWGFPAFNVADSCITVGAIGLLLLLLREDRAAAKAAREVSS